MCEIQDVAFEEQNNVQQQEDVEAIEIPKLRRCKICKQDLPIDRFSIYGTGHRHICKSCEKGIKNPSEKFKDITSKELIDELRRRGYKGKLTYVEVTEVKI